MPVAARLHRTMDGGIPPDRLDFRVDRLLMPDLVAVLAAGAPALVLLAFRHDIVFAWGGAAWGIVTAALVAAAAFAGFRLFDRRPLLIAGAHGIAVPRLIADWIPWRDIADITGAVEPLAWGDRRDVLRIGFEQPRTVPWLQPPKGPVDTGGLQAGFGVRLSARWPLRAESLCRHIEMSRRAALPSTPATLASATDPWQRPSRNLRVGAAIMCALIVTFGWQAIDGGLAKQTSAGVRLYMTGDLVAALPALESDARRGDAEAQVTLATMYENGDGVGRNQAAALSWFRRAALAGHPGAEVELGLIHQNGRGVPVDMAAAEQWFTRAAERGAAPAQYRLAQLYRDGLIDGRRDYDRALLWLTRAAEQDHAAAATDLARLYTEGLGVPRSMTTALRWLNRAAGRGHAPASYRLGRLYGQGQGVDRDAARAAAYHAEAAEQGYAPAQYALGLAYNGGVGVTQDPLAAYVWLALAQKGLPPHQAPRAARVLALVAAGLDAESQDRARRAVREFRPRRANP